MAGRIMEDGLIMVMVHGPLQKFPMVNRVEVDPGTLVLKVGVWGGYQEGPVVPSDQVRLEV